MEEVKKLKVLVKHWCDHNIDHANTYESWARKMQVAGNEEAYRILREICSKTEELNKSFEQLSKIIL